MIESDDVSAMAKWKLLRATVIEPRIAEHNGRLIRVIGDGLFLEFKSAVDAVRWALAVQNAIAGEVDDTTERLEMRIGINVEDVIVDDDDLHGDGVNIASRIQQLAEPGEVVITATVRDYVWNKMPIAITDLGIRELKNISRPVQLYHVEETSDAGNVRRIQSSGMDWNRLPSIAVLPFRNPGGDRDEDYFGEGMTEDIITALSRTRSLFVIARNSTLRYRNREIETRQIAAELGVRYVLEGSVRRQASRLRISAELIDATQSRSLWAERYDGANDDLFEFQDRISSSIVATIEPRVHEAELERIRSKPTASLGAYDCVLRALPLLHGFDPAQWDEAIGYFSRATALDPRYAQAYAYRAWVHVLMIGENRSTDVARDAKLAMDLVDKAMALDHGDAFVVAVTAHVLALLHKRLDAATELFDRAIELNENSVFAWGMSALTYAYLGRPEEAMARLNRAWRLSPFDPFNYFFLAAAGLTEFIAGRYESAIPWLRKALRLNPRFLPAHRHLVTSLANAGRDEEAREAARELLRIEPGFDIRTLARWYPLQPADNLERYLLGLRMAGLPEDGQMRLQ